MLVRLTSWRVLGALSIVAVLVSGLMFTDPAVEAEPAEPQFFDWGGRSFDDGLRHYLVRLDPEISIETAGPFALSADGIISIRSEALPDWVSGDLVLTVEDVAGLGRNETVSSSSLLAGLDGIEDVQSLGYDVFAVATTYAAEQLLELPGVLAVHTDSPVRTASVDEFYPYQWSLENVGLTADGSPATRDADTRTYEAWHRTRGAGVVVAVIDSGVDIGHPDLAGNIWANPGEICGNDVDDDGNGFVDDCNGWDFVTDTGDVSDTNGHGTHVAGIIAATFNNLTGIAGVAPEATIMPLKIGAENPSLSNAMRAIDYAVANGARVVNASWVSDDPAAADYLAPHLEAAEAAGVLVVAGAGNDGTSLDTNPLWPAASPQPNVVTVAASTAEDRPAGFSNFGSTSVDLYAPGDRIVSTLPGGGYGVYSGTSMAAPHVAGAAALLWAATPEATYQEVKGALLDRSDGPNDGLDSFRNLAASDGRLNVSRSIFTRLFQSEVVYWFHDFNLLKDDEPHEVTVRVLLNDPDNVPPVTPLRYRATLVAPRDGQILSVVGHPIVVPGIGEVVTDRYGRAFIGDVFERQRTHALLEDGQLVPFTMSLPRGSYALVTELLDMTDPAQPRLLGQASAVFFEVGLSTAQPFPTVPIPSSPTTVASTSTTVPTTVTIPLPPSTTTTTEVAPIGSTIPPEPTPDTSTTTTTAPANPTTTTAPVTTSTVPATTSTTTPPHASTTTTTSTSLPEPSDTSPFLVGGINPNRGPVTGGTEVAIVGEGLPSKPLVVFGGNAAEIDLNDAPESYIVVTPPGSTGVTDVTILDLDTGDKVVLEDAFTYYSDGTEPPLPPTTTTTLPVIVPTTTIPVPTTSTSPTTTTLAAVTSTTTTSTTLPTSTTGPPTTTAVDSGPTIDDWFGSRLVTPDGLELGELAPDSPLQNWDVHHWAGGICNDDVCRGWDL